MSNGHIKICGIRKASEYVAAVDAGATAIGFVFFENSPRNIAPEALAALLREAGEADAKHSSRPWHVGVFVEPTPELLRVAIDAGLTHVQPHGAVSSEAASTIAESGVGLLRPIAVKQRLGAADFEPPPPPCPPPTAWLCDTFDAAEHGGTGRQFHHDHIRAVLPTHPIWIAGGLSPDNVGEVLGALPGIEGVDVSSGVEYPASEVGARGVKDVARIRAFIAAARSSFAAMPQRR